MRVLTGRSMESQVLRLERRQVPGWREMEPRVRRIVAEVRTKGDRALRRYAQRWDGLGKDQPIAVSEAELAHAWQQVPPQFKRALAQAAANIRRFCQWQKPAEWRREIRPGVCVGQIVRPLHSVGCYVPGGRYPLPSTLLMTVIPAQVAGVRHIRIASPRPALETLAAAAMLEVREFYRVGGAQAIAALAYGTATVPRVEKLVGPGNRFVTAAKKLVAFDCPIDMQAGPTETVVVAPRGQPQFIAADLVAQAEHDPDALVLLITTSERLARSVAREVRQRSRGNPIARQSLRQHGAILVTRSIDEATAIANRIAPEHLTLPGDESDAVQNAGSVFLGDWSPQAAGDYITGPNHVLPTGGAARFRGGLSVLDFVKVIAVQQLSPEGLAPLAASITTLAQAEGLVAHSESIRVRCGDA